VVVPLPLTVKASWPSVVLRSVATKLTLAPVKVVAFAAASSVTASL